MILPSVETAVQCSCFAFGISLLLCELHKDLNCCPMCLLLTFDALNMCFIFQSRYAFELLSNPLWKRDYDLFGVNEHIGIYYWKRDYDLFGVDEHIDVLEKIKQQYAGKTFTSVKLPLLGDV
ncbi:hypothetical protein Droror1_Dr00021621 [Drosera rotundifolia]